MNWDHLRIVFRDFPIMACLPYAKIRFYGNTVNLIYNDTVLARPLLFQSKGCKYVLCPNCQNYLKYLKHSWMPSLILIIFSFQNKYLTRFYWIILCLSYLLLGLYLIHSFESLFCLIKSSPKWKTALCFFSNLIF